LKIIVVYDNRYVIFLIQKNICFGQTMWPLLISAPAFTYLISAVVMCQLSSSGPVQRPFLNKKILERLVQAIGVIDNPNKPG
jgi:hypothetical protein